MAIGFEDIVKARAVGITNDEEMVGKLRGLFEQLEAENESLKPFEQAIKSRHNGYGSDSEPETPRQALDELLNEAELLGCSKRESELEAENKDKQELIDELCSQKPCPKCGYGVTGQCYGCIIKQLKADNERLKEEIKTKNIIIKELNKRLRDIGAQC